MSSILDKWKLMQERIGFSYNLKKKFFYQQLKMAKRRGKRSKSRQRSILINIDLEFAQLQRHVFNQINLSIQDRISFLRRPIPSTLILQDTTEVFSNIPLRPIRRSIPKQCMGG